MRGRFGVLPQRKAVEGGRFGQTKDDYWESAQRELLKDPRKLQEDMVNYDKDNIPEKVISKIEPYLTREDFDPAQLKKSSVAAEISRCWLPVSGRRMSSRCQ